ncbi:hypothetical protein VUJ46_03530 [Chryseobacterium sp. MYb264]|uniref:hypothetical protein n=1 Tax=Chryseobacterium sp. MYb264 TaxID=2745153 RepID=UPI002E149319|nr:hypothetical protein VUJ46_03530 [Chryseobacterium sp. MYb264]
MEREEIPLKFREAILNLLRLAELYCWNKVSLNIQYILSDSSEMKEELSGSEKRRLQNRINSKKIPIDFEKAIKFLRDEFSDLYDVNLYIFKSKKKSTIVDIRYFKKSNLDVDFLQTVKDNSPMLHSKLPLPIYRNDFKKINVNWESGSLDHYLKELIHNFKNRNKFKR